MKKIILSSVVLFQVLEFANKAISRNTIIPILQNFFCEVKGGILSVCGSDYKISAIARVQVEGKEDFCFMLPLNALKYVKEMEEQPVVVSYDPHTHKVQISNEDGIAKYGGENPSDYVKLPECDTKLLQFPSEYLGAFKDLSNYASNDELRPAITGIYFGYHEGQFAMAATNGHILKEQLIPELDQKKLKRTGTLFLLPKKAAQILCELSPSKADQKHVKIKVTHSKADGGVFKHVQFENDYGSITREIPAAVVNERFPDYRSKTVIPDEKDILTRYTFSKKFLLGLLAKAPNFYNNTTKQVEFRLTHDKPTFFVENMNDGNEFVADLKNDYNGPCTIDGPEIQIAFNAAFLKQVISSGNEVQTFQLRKANNGALIRTDKTTLLLMPVMIHSYK